MGSEVPFRIELFDDEIDSLRSFDPETQRSDHPVDTVKLLPAREFPLDAASTEDERPALLELDVGRAHQERVEPLAARADDHVQLHHLHQRLAGCLLLLLPICANAAVDPAQFQELRWRLLGPFRGGRVLAVSGVPEL